MSCEKALKAIVLTTAVLLLPQAGAQPANVIDCGDKISGQPLVTVPVLESKDGMLSGTLYTVSEQQKMTTPKNGLGSDPYCFPQWVRAYRPTAPSSWNPPASVLNNPMPGPTLRARVGDVVALTFLNVIDPNKFPGVVDGQCDASSNYPGPNTIMTSPDHYPDCFASSVYTNVHYHGTHTNPNTTGDNVFLEISPSPRKTDGSNAPTITAPTVQPAFAEFFAACKQQLMASDGPKIWPRVWTDLPSSVRKLLMDAVKQSKPAWWTADQKLIAKGNWPQYYVGAVPYCFRLPSYKSASPASTATPSVHTPHTRGAGTAEVDEASAPELPLIMGQAPGTHWYHAHKHGSTTINVMNGMTGVFIIEGEYDDAINKYYGENWTRKQPVLVVQQLGSLPGLVSNLAGGPGADFSINGQLHPTISMPGNSVQMWRIANTSSRAGLQFQAPTGGLQWMQLAQDGVQFDDVNYKASLNKPVLLASGNRADLLVKAPAYKSAGQNSYDVLVFNTIDPSDHAPQKPNVAAFRMLTVNVTPNGTDMSFMPAAPPFPPFLNDVTDKEIAGTKVLKFASAPIAPVPNTKFPSQQFIDGKQFDGEVGVAVLLNRAEEWKVVNETYPPANSNQISHPFHIHINPFQISEIFDPNAILSQTAGTGTLDLAARVSGSNTAAVTGHGTSFTKDLRIGDWLWVKTTQTTDPNIGPSMVIAIADDTNLTLNNSQSAPITGATYVIATPLYTIDKAGARPGQCVLNPTDEASWKPCSSVVPPVDRTWHDVYSIPSGSMFTTDGKTLYKIPGYFKMRSRFVDYSGYYVLHCHILAHEDRGMMTVVEVVPLQTPYSHH
jgi:FtsP/CotA-like multicopper oxidase with cupredoxin domain